MIDLSPAQHVDDALAALQTALSAREVYWAEHTAATSALRAAFSHLRATLALQDSVTLLFLPDRIVFDGRELPSGPRLAAGIGHRFRERGIESLTFEKTLAHDELETLLRLLCDGSLGTHSTIAGILLHRITTDGTGPAATHASGTSGPAISSHRAESLNPIALRLHAKSVDAAHQLWSSVTTDAALSGGHVQMAASNILEMLAACGGGALPLAAVKSHDEYTYIHATNVAVLSGALAESIGLAAPLVRDITLGALLHDVGKQRIPLPILNKPGKLDAAELSVVQQHPVDGARILAGVDDVTDLALIIAYEHHMHLDGTGYPRPARGRSTHLASRIVQLADVYDALGTHRPYRVAMPAEKIRQIMSDRRGNAYESDLFDVFFHMVLSRLPAPAPVQPETPVLTPAAAR